MAESTHILEGDALKYTVEEIHELNKQIHQYLRLTSQSMTIFALIATAVATAYIVKSELLRYGILLLAPVVLAVISIYHFNVANEVAALVELRDKLSERVNRELKTPIFLSSSMSDIVRGSLGTKMSVLLVGCIILAVISVGIYNAWNTPWFIPQIVVSIFSVVAAIITLMDIERTRRRARKKLKEIFATSEKSHNATHTQTK